MSALPSVDEVQGAAKDAMSSLQVVAGNAVTSVQDVAGTAGDRIGNVFEDAVDAVGGALGRKNQRQFGTMRTVTLVIVGLAVGALAYKSLRSLRAQTQTNPIEGETPTDAGPRKSPLKKGAMTKH